jgi:hypothetical protein
MSNGQDSNSNAQGDAGESLKDVAQSQISSTEKDALGERALDEVSGGSLLYSGGYSLATKGLPPGTPTNSSAPGG